MPVGYQNMGYSPVAGVWYPVKEPVMPRVYHRYLRIEVLKQIYNDIKTSDLSANSFGEDLS